MTKYSFDPRDLFRTGLGTKIGNVDGIDEYCIQISYKGDTINVPIFLSEEVKSENLPTMPYMELFTVMTTYEPQDISASTRKMESHIDGHIYFTDIDNIDRTTFAKLIKDELHDLVRANQSTTTGIFFMNIDNDRLVTETNARQVVYHYLFSLYILFYDLC